MVLGFARHSYHLLQKVLTCQPYLALQGELSDWLTWCQYTVTLSDTEFDLYLSRAERITAWADSSLRYTLQGAWTFSDKKQPTKKQQPTKQKTKNNNNNKKTVRNSGAGVRAVCTETCLTFWRTFMHHSTITHRLCHIRCKPEPPKDSILRS